jgi:hypothetical protein
MSLRILVTGSRALRDTPANRAMIRAALVEALTLPGHGVPVLVHGAQRSEDRTTGELYGSDYLCEQVWRDLGAETHRALVVERYPADWTRFGDRAGPIRNQGMCRLGAAVCLAFLDASPCIGTRGCIREAKRHGIPVRQHRAPAAPQPKEEAQLGLYPT